MLQAASSHLFDSAPGTTPSTSQSFLNRVPGPPPPAISSGRRQLSTGSLGKVLAPGARPSSHSDAAVGGKAASSYFRPPEHDVTAAAMRKAAASCCCFDIPPPSTSTFTEPSSSATWDTAPLLLWTSAAPLARPEGAASAGAEIAGVGGSGGARPPGSGLNVKVLEPLASN
eukprot:scaffold3326_cov116-Isochrysis_galbana.AAC.10